MSPSIARKEACLASERVRIVANWSMNVEREKASTVPEFGETMVAAGNRISFTFRLDSVSAIMASSMLVAEGAQRATGTPRDKMREAALLEEPD